MDEEPPRFDSESAVRLRRVIVRLARTFNDSASAEGLSPSQASILAVVGSRGPLALAALAEFEGINPTMLSRIVTKLDGEGLIRRMPNPDDQRAALVEATERGRETSERIRTARTAVVTKLVSGLPADTAAAVLAALPALEAMAGLTERDNSTADGAKGYSQALPPSGPRS
jgi:DNA-binding MarR family transcriptional regulator